MAHLLSGVVVVESTSSLHQKEFRLFVVANALPITVVKNEKRTLEFQSTAFGGST